MADAPGLADFLSRLNWSPERLAREVNRVCGEGAVSAKAPYHWLRGSYPRRGIPETVVRVLSQHLRETIEIDAIWPQAAAAPRTSQVTAAPEISPLVRDSCTSARLVQNVSQTNADSPTLDQLRSEFTSIVAAYQYMPPKSLIYRAAMGRDRVGRLLQGNQQPPQRLQLLAFAAQFCALLAWMSDDLKDGNAAYNQALAGWSLAELSESNAARRLVLLSQARQAYWSQHYLESARLAAQATELPADDGLDTLLILMSARAWAEAGLAEHAEKALAEAATFQQHASNFRPGIPIRNAHAYLAGHTLLAMGDPVNALTELTDALNLTEQLPVQSRSYALRALIRVDLLRVKLSVGDLTGGLRELEPVFTLSPDQVINMVELTLTAARAELLNDFAGHAAVRQTIDRIDELTKLTVY